MYKQKNAFLLMELMLAVTIMSFSIILFGQFFSYVCEMHYDIRNRLDAMITAQNMLEMMWYNQRTDAHADTHVVTYVSLPLPVTIGDLPMTNAQISYNIIKVRNKKSKTTISLPGYIYVTS